MLGSGTALVRHGASVAAHGAGIACLYFALLLAICLAMFGCSSLPAHRKDLERLHASGQWQAAAALLDDPKTQNLYDSGERVLWQMDRGALALALSDPDTTITQLNDAERDIELNRERSLSDAAAQWVLNDAAAAYLVPPYEDIYVNVLKLTAQLAAGRIQGGATVEARRLASKADTLRDRYLTYERALRERGGTNLDQLRSRAPLEAVNTDGQFVESTLGTFLTAVTFMKSGDRELQRVAGRRLQSSIELQRGLIGAVDANAFAELGETDPDTVNTLLVAFSGRGPRKEAERIGPIAIASVPIYMELPRLVPSASEAQGVRVEIDGFSPVTLSLVEDLGRVATENHKRELPQIYARTLLRYLVKAGLLTAATEVAQEDRRRSRSRRGQGEDQWVRFVGGAIGAAILYATERADLRAWVFLPGRAHVALTKLPEGVHQAVFVYLGAGGGVLYRVPVTLEVSASGLTTRVATYWR